MTNEAINPGARPADTTTESSASQEVQTLFDTIAPTYDRLNHILSFGLDRLWWRRTAQVFRNILARPEARIVDLCCGTGDQTAALLAARPRTPAAQPIIGLDFSAQMLARARKKYPETHVQWLEGDAMHLPFADNSVDLVTAAFGFRNLPNYAKGLAEIHRVLRPGGQIGILEANQPTGLNALLYNTYFHRILPVVGGFLSGQRAAYRYLPASVQRFPRPPRMLEMLAEAGFNDPHWKGYLFQAAGLYRATKA
jgi:demethylmenaquinone methyltransferase / 2-methoxy-6-polyprenyl-1,4-benzoquinol methylase